MKIRKAYQGTVPENKILDTYSTSQTDTYSCNYVNKYEEVVLYNNSTGTNGTVTLSETSANFTYLEVFYRDYDNHYNSVKIYNPNGKVFWMTGGWINDNNNGGNIKVAYSTINGTSITKTRYLEGTIGGSGTSNHNYIYIVRVVGYR